MGIKICLFGLFLLKVISMFMKLTVLSCFHFRYMAPEYFMHGITHEKTDVFAFGVILLELITGRRSVNSDRQSLVKWVCFESLLI